MTDLRDSRFYDLLPPNLKNAQAQALSAALDRQMRVLCDRLPQLLIYADIQALREDMCDAVARNFSVNGYALTHPLAKKRALLQSAFVTGLMRGTKGALDKAVGILHEGAQTTEWFNHNGPPYTFRVHIPVGPPVDMDALQRQVDAYKNVRSHMEATVLRAKHRITARTPILTHTRTACPLQLHTPRMRVRSTTGACAVLPQYAKSKIRGVDNYG